MDLHTFSVVARGSDGDVGVAVATARPNVGSLVPWVSLHGAIATQAHVDTDLGRHGLALLEQEVPIDVALPALLARDPERERRQVHGVDRRRGFVHTGRECVAWCGHEKGPDFSVAGNMLAGPQVIGAMASAFRRTASLELPERLLVVLEAGQAAGGDKRGKVSAALLVASAEPRMYHNLRVDDHEDPVAELRRVFDRVVAHVKDLIVGLIAGIRRILVLTAEFSEMVEEGGDTFRPAMLELGLLTMLVLALVGALAMLRRRVTPSTTAP